MARQSSVNLDIGPSGDGYSIGGGTTSKRTFTLTSGDVQFVGGTINTYTFPSGSCVLASAMPSYINQTAGRALNTTYANSNSNRSILVIASVRCAISSASGDAYFQAKSDQSTPPSGVASGIIGTQTGLLNSNNTYEITFAVASGTGTNYRIDTTTNNGTTTLNSWYELTW